MVEHGIEPNESRELTLLTNDGPSELLLGGEPQHEQCESIANASSQSCVKHRLCIEGVQGDSEDQRVVGRGYSNSVEEARGVRAI